MLVSTCSISPTQTRAFGLMTLYTTTNRPPHGFLSVPNTPPCFPGFTQLTLARVFCFRFLSFPLVIEWSTSWGIQLILRIVLAIGCVFLPPSPGLLVAQGRIDEALQTLVELHLRSECEVHDDPLPQVRFCCFVTLSPRFPRCHFSVFL